MKRRFLLSAAAFSAVVSTTAYAQIPAVKFGVISLIGESITISGARPMTGSRIDQNDKRVITIPDAGFDATALRTLQETVKQLQPQSEALLFAIKAPKWVETPTELFDGNKVLMSPKLVAAMKADGATQLLLLTRHKSDAQLRFDNGVIGSGRVEGLGFYIDRSQRVINYSTNETTRGFLGSYLSLRLSLVDLNTSTVTKQRLITGSRIHTLTDKQTSVDPWDSLSATDKLASLNRLVEHDLKAALRDILSGT